MEISEAIGMIRFAPANEQPQAWADLGCGPGVFTKALASILPPASRVIAIDKDEKAIQQIPKYYNGVSIETSVHDFTSYRIPFSSLDGILMANSLHYVKDKEQFVKRMMDVLGANGVFLLVDYDMHKANPWVPYPLPIADAIELFAGCGAPSFQVLNKRKSVFGNRWMYSALIGK